MPSTVTGRREVGFSQSCLCTESEVAMITSAKETTVQLDDELRQCAFKKIIDICEDSNSRDDIHMTIQCPNAQSAKLVRR